MATKRNGIYVMNKERRDIRWVLVSAVGGGGIEVCACAAPCLLGRFSSWQRWPISRLILKVTLAGSRIVVRTAAE